MLEQLKEKLLDYSSSVTPEEWVWGAAVAFVSVVGIAYGAKIIRKRKGKDMARKNEIKELMCDMIENGLLDLHTDEKLTTKEVNALHEKFAKQHGFWDLHPRKLLKEPPKSEDLKEDIRNRTGGLLQRGSVKSLVHTLVLKKS